jgi:quinol monooxygenase YgiN
MIRHIVFFSAKAPEHKETIFEGLSTLKQIPHKLHLEVGRNHNSDPISPEGPDFVLYAEFEDEAQLAAYKAHPIYQKGIEIVRPLRDMRIAADYKIEV